MCSGIAEAYCFEDRRLVHNYFVIYSEAVWRRFKTYFKPCAYCKLLN